MVSSILLAVLILLAGIYLAGNAGERALAASEISEPTVIGPFNPAVFNGSLRDLPQIEAGETTGGEAWLRDGRKAFAGRAGLG
jgi:hypothetical protein